MSAASPRRSASRAPLAALFLIASTCGSPTPEPTPPPGPAAPSPALRAAYLAAVQAEAGAEYRFHPGPTAAAPQRADNPAQRLVAALAPHGLLIAPIDGLAERHLELALVGLGCASQVTPPPDSTPRWSHNRVEYARATVTEWYLNGPLGIEQGFIVPQRPGCARGEGLRLDVGLGDAVVPTLHGSGDGDSSYVELHDRAGQLWLRYSDVYAVDAHSRPLPVRLAIAAGQIRLLIDDAQATYPISIDPLIWTLQQQLLGSDTAAEDFFGRGLALSGTTAVIGAFQAGLPAKANAGAAYVFVRAGAVWTQQQKLTASDAAADAAFGYAVAVSGDTVVVGAPGATQSGAANAGAAYVFTRSGTLWTQQKRLVASDFAAEDNFGDSVAVDGTTAVVGADYADRAGMTDAGAAYVFVRAGTAWTEQQKLVAGDASDGAHLGQAAALSGSSVVLGAPYADAAGKSSAGAAYVFTRTGTTWTQEQKLTASDADDADSLGTAVALASNQVLAGAPGSAAGGKADAGAAYLFTRTGMTWAQTQKLTAATPAASDNFGDAVALTASSALIGADGAGGGGTAYVFTLAGATWSQQQTLSSPLSGADGNFGRSLAMDGSYAVLGAPFSTVSGKSSSGVAFAMVLGMAKPNGQLCLGNAECTSGFCVDSVCCNAACGGGTPDCQACSIAAGAPSDGTCATAKSGAVCRAATGACDAVETCDGMATSCPTDAFRASTVQCRAAAGLCDVAEFCTGTAAACPSDNLKPTGVECRSAIGACDVAEACSGLSQDCPADSFKPNTTECRPSAGSCDVADFCTGSGATCPTDQLKPMATPCRAAAGLCDAAESCTGLSATCPADGFLKLGVECRKAAGPCDAAEVCSGAAIDCPADVLLPNTKECRPATAVCDSAEFCTGTAVDCPRDGFKPSTAECRPSAGACDVAEYCSGGGPACPQDNFQPSTTACRAAVGPCDAPEQCPGDAPVCPSDRSLTNGTACTGGSCQSGMCRLEADLSLTLVASPTAAHGQEPVTVQLTVQDLSPTPATAVKLRLQAPPGTTLSSGDGWTCQSSADGASCERTRLDPAAATALAFAVVPPKTAPTFAITASVTASEFDPSPSNNSATLQLENDAPTPDGGCTMGRGRAPTAAGPPAVALGLLLAALARRRRRVR